MKHKIGQISCNFWSNGTLSVKSNKTGKKHTTHEVIRAVTGVFNLALINSVIIVIATIPNILHTTEIKNICKKVKL